MLTRKQAKRATKYPNTVISCVDQIDNETFKMKSIQISQLSQAKAFNAFALLQPAVQKRQRLALDHNKSTHCTERKGLFRFVSHRHQLTERMLFRQPQSLIIINANKL